MQTQDIYEILKEKFGDEILNCEGEPPSEPFITVNPQKIADICLFLRDEASLEFDYLSSLSGMDYTDSLGVVYHLWSMKHKHTLVIKTALNREDPKIASVENIWRSADWHEREAWDLFGIVFEGHHNLIRILNPYDWEGFPLRKDYKTPDSYHDMKVPY